MQNQLAHNVSTAIRVLRFRAVLLASVVAVSACSGPVEPHMPARADSLRVHFDTAGIARDTVPHGGGL